MRKIIPAFLTYGAVVALFAMQASSTAEVRYAQDGAFLFPQDYRTWTFVTSGLGMSYGPSGASDAQGNLKFDNVFASPTAYRGFQQNGVWPDKTVLVLELRGSSTNVSINRSGYVQTGVVDVEVHVKDAARGGWAFYAFRPGQTQAKMIPRSATCYSCHEQHGSVDTTFVQFYPTLSGVANR